VKTRARLSVVTLLALLPAAAGPAAAGAQGPLREHAARRNFYVGAAVAVRPLRNDQLYRETLRREFNMVVAENAFKWSELRPARRRFDFRGADAVVEFARANRMAVRGHTLVWHRQIPRWLARGKFARDEVVGLLRQHVRAVVGRYRGRVSAWDVVNEAVDDETGGLRTDSFWHRALGPEYIELAFRFAREADPKAKLYYNDYSAEGMNKKSDGVYRLLSDLKSRGVPVDGVGWQMHELNGFRVGPGHRENAKRLTALGLELSITEMDVRMKLPASRDDYERQAEGYASAAEFCLSEPNCKALVLWGFADKYSWIPGEFPGWGDGLIYDRDFRPKPAYSALRRALAAEAARP
jgi:endo-1,4-beta-xylanase